jgi:hypothetical protein
MAASKGFGKAERSTVRCIDIRIKVITTRVVVGRKEITGQSRAGRYRMKSVIGCRPSEAVTVLEWVRQLGVTDSVASDTDGCRRHCSGWVGARSDSQLVGESSTGVEVLLGHLGLE